ncbi:MAG: LD-carboxypeptidase [Brachymonas sp.]
MQARIYVYSPSGAVRDKKAFRLGLKRLQAAGYAVQADDSALASHLRFAGDDATRLAALARAAASGADMALITRGGYGLTRILGQIDYAAISASIQNGMAWMGYSDFTALQLALLAQQGAGRHSLTWAGLGVMGDVACANRDGAEPDDITMACLDDVLQGYAEGTGWRMSAAQGRSWQAAYGAGEHQIDDAVLWGGNLCVLSSLLGTPYFPHFAADKKGKTSGVHGGVLFLEDVAEHPYRIERMLTQLLHAGVLHSQRAIVLGAFSDYRLSAHDKGFDMKAVVAWLRSQLPPEVLLLEGLPFGHVETKVCLPVGQRISLQLSGRDVLLLWGALHPHADDGHEHGAGCGPDCQQHRAYPNY